jgi:glutathione S-transferase
MIKIHHLNNSRSHRVLWLLEELGVKYQLIKYQRDKITNLAPKELKEVHSLGKSPVLQNNDETIIESGAIVTYIIDQYADEVFYPKFTDSDYYQYLQLMHYAEGSAIAPFILQLYMRFLGNNSEPLQPRIKSEIKKHLSYLANILGNNDYFFRNQFSGVDIMLSFVIEAGKISGALIPFPNLEALLKRYQNRVSYKKAIEFGGDYLVGK